MSILPMKSKFDDIKHTDSFGNEYCDCYINGRNELRYEQRNKLTKLEAEL